MTPQTGQHVKCILRNGAMAEGIVEEWFANEVQLRSLDGESVLIITHPSEDIMLIKILLEPKVQEEIPEEVPFIDIKYYEEPTKDTEVITSDELIRQQSILDSKFTDAQRMASSDPNRIPTLAQLKTLLAEHEKKIVSEKVRNHYPGSAYDLSKRTKVTYGYPGFIKKPSPK